MRCDRHIGTAHHDVPFISEGTLFRTVRWIGLPEVIQDLAGAPGNAAALPLARLSRSTSPIVTICAVKDERTKDELSTAGLWARGVATGETGPASIERGDEKTRG
jgi:hypothetical protein